MSAVVERHQVNDRHMRVVWMRLEGRTLSQIAKAMNYASPQVVSGILATPAVKLYHEKMRARLEDRFTDVSRFLYSDLVDFAAIPVRG